MAVKRDEITKKWYCVGYVSIDGKKQWYKKRGFEKKSDAIEEEIKIRKKLKLKKDQSQKKFKDLKDEYLKYAESRVKRSTITKDVYALNKWSEVIGNVPIIDLDKTKIQTIIDKWDSMYTKRYVEKLYYVLSACLEYALKQDYILANPIRKVERSNRPNEKPQEMEIWEPEEFEQFLSVIDDNMYRSFFMILFYMGMRKGECLALQWKDIDIERKTINIEKTTGARDRLLDPPYTTPKTRNSYRIITMPDVLVDQLRKYRDDVSGWYGFSDDAFLFGTDRPMPAENIRRNFNKYIKESGVKPIRIHDLRHSHASYLINNMSAGFTDFDIAKRLGDTVATLHNTYAHWFKRKDENIVNFINLDTKKAPE